MITHAYTETDYQDALDRETDAKINKACDKTVELLERFNHDGEAVLRYLDEQDAKKADAASTLHSTRVPTRTKQLRELHLMARQAGFDTRPGSEGRERYEAFLLRTIKRTSTRQAVRSERERVIDELRRMVDGSYRMANARPVEVVSDDEAGAFL